MTFFSIVVKVESLLRNGFKAGFYDIIELGLVSKINSSQIISVTAIRPVAVIFILYD